MGMFNPPHPGALIADILENGGLKVKTVTGLASILALHGQRFRGSLMDSAVSADMALRLQDAFGMRADLWLSLQWKRDLWVASQ